jgi:hypothetical protein
MGTASKETLGLYWEGDPFVGPAVGSVGVGLEQDAHVEQLSSMCPATTDERFELAALLFGMFLTG